jgi:hypothetical protein
MMKNFVGNVYFGGIFLYYRKCFVLASIVNEDYLHIFVKKVLVTDAFYGFLDKILAILDAYSYRDLELVRRKIQTSNHQDAILKVLDFTEAD